MLCTCQHVIKADGQRKPKPTASNALTTKKLHWAENKSSHVDNKTPDNMAPPETRNPKIYTHPENPNLKTLHLNTMDNLKHASTVQNRPNDIMTHPETPKPDTQNAEKPGPQKHHL